MSSSKGFYGTEVHYTTYPSLHPLNILIDPTHLNNLHNSQGDTSFRKRWDKDEYAKKSQEKKAEQDDSKSNTFKLLPHSKQQYLTTPFNHPLGKLEDDDAPKKLLQGRTKAVDFDSVVGKTQVVQVTGGKQPGFHCKVCDIVMKDSVSYLDHINSRIRKLVQVCWGIIVNMANAL